MSLYSLRKEIEGLRTRVANKHKPGIKVFIMGVKESPTKEEVEAYRESHPLSRVIVLMRRSCREIRTG